MKWIIRFFYIILILIFGTSLTGCDSDPDGPHPPKVPESERTVLVYMVANNNLGSYGYDSSDISEMIQGASQGAIKDNCRWLVYRAPAYNGTATLFEVTASDTVKLKEYSAGESVTYSRMTEVFDDMAAFAPATKYGLVLWSHASGWIVEGIEEDLPSEPYAAQPLSFGNDGGQKMDVATLRTAVKGRGFDYIYFDACFMATIEVAYELRDAVDYLVGSPSELPSDGMRYDLNMSCLTDGSPDSLIQAAKNTFNHYNSYAQASMRTCTMSVTSTSALVDLAKATKSIYEVTPLPHPAQKVTNYRGFERQGYSIDFGEYVNALAVDSKLDMEMIDNFNVALNKAVIYKEATEKLWNEWPIYSTSGLSTFVFNLPKNFSTKSYNTLQWAKDVVSFHVQASDE